MSGSQSGADDWLTWYAILVREQARAGRRRRRYTFLARVCFYFSTALALLALAGCATKDQACASARAAGGPHTEIGQLACGVQSPAARAALRAACAQPGERKYLEQLACAGVTP